MLSFSFSCFSALVSSRRNFTRDFTRDEKNPQLCATRSLSSLIRRGIQHDRRRSFGIPVPHKRLRTAVSVNPFRCSRDQLRRVFRDLVTLLRATGTERSLRLSCTSRCTRVYRVSKNRHRAPSFRESARARSMRECARVRGSVRYAGGPSRAARVIYARSCHGQLDTVTTR